MKNGNQLPFLDMMTPHQESAIVTSNDELTEGEHRDIKFVLRKIPNFEEAKIKQMEHGKVKLSK